jgi:hypothetical protein
MRPFLCLLLGTLVLLCGCEDKSTEAPPARRTYFFSFEDGMEEWQGRGIDLELGDTLIAWSIQRTQEMAKAGSTAMKFYLENWNDAGKIWIEHPFAVQPDCSYDVNISYAFASADFGMANLWTIITGVVSQRPQTRDDLVYQDHTGNGSDTDVGYRWLEKSYVGNVTAAADGEIYVMVGIWGTWETPRTYYLDSLSILFTKKI